MNSQIRPIWLKLSVLLLLSLVFLRFLHLDADFPSGVDWSGDLYTDEGWYANAAVRDVISGKWYLPGDFNPAVNMPLGQLLLRLEFKVFGLSLWSARVLVASAFTIVIMLASLIVGRGAGLQAGLLTALILTSSYIGFAFSRMAIMEPIGLLFVMLALFLVQRAQGKHAWLPIGVAAFVVGAAVLVKSNMIFALPLAVFLVAQNNKTLRQRVLLSICIVAVFVAVVHGWQLVASYFFNSDYTYFNKINLQARRVTSIGAWEHNVGQQCRNMLVLGKRFLMASALLIAGATLLAPGFRANPVVRVLAVYAAGYFAMLTVIAYGPPRYFLPLTIPLAGLDAIGCVALAEWLHERSGARIFVASPYMVVAAIMLLGWARVGSDVLSPRYSFVHMTSAVGTIIHQREGRLAGVVLLGNMADSVALETGVTAINTVYGTLPLADRLRKYHPAYVLVHTDDTILLGSIHRLGGRETRLGAWDVYGNYYGRGQQVRLFGVDWKHPAGAGQLSPR